MTKLTTIYCPATSEYAIIERDSYGPALVSRGEIRQIGSYWFKVDANRPGTSAPQVCEGFSESGTTLLGDGAPIRTANKVYKTKARFESAVTNAYA